MAGRKERTSFSTQWKVLENQAEISFPRIYNIADLDRKTQELKKNGPNKLKNS